MVILFLFDTIKPMFLPNPNKDAKFQAFKSYELLNFIRFF